MDKAFILLVDDEVDFAETLSLQLSFHGFKVKLAHSGKEALEAAQREKPDLILLDIMMPGMDGYQVCSALRQIESCRNIPVIMLTAKHMAQDKIEGFKIGADDYVPKASDFEELVARIDAVLRRTSHSVIIEKENIILIEKLRETIAKSDIRILFQPIVNLTSNKVMGYEIFTRGPKEYGLENPIRLFRVAYETGLLFDLEMVVRTKALSVSAGKMGDALLFFNCSPSLVMLENFHELLALYKDPHNIVLELTEQSEICDFPTFAKKIQTFKDQGFRIAIDDIGSGFSSLTSMVELAPDFVKIDKYLIKNVDKDEKKLNVIKTIYSMCKQSNVVAIAEGIETKEQLDMVKSIGIDVGQGYFLGMPEAAD